jgi:hypothetical protein
MGSNLAIEYGIQSWLSNILGHHPLLAWIFGHPLWSLGILLGILILLSGLFQAIGRGSEKIWIWLLTLPINILKVVVKFLWSNGSKLINYYRDREPIIVEEGEIIEEEELTSPSSTSEQIKSILNRLEILHQEETDLLNQLATLINHNDRPNN